MGDEFAQRVAAIQGFARAPGFQNLLRVHQHAVPGAGHLDFHHAFGRGQHQSAQQHRPDVVTVTRTTGGGLALQRKGIQGLARQGLVEQGICRHQCRHATGSRAAHARTQRYALFDLDREAEWQLERRPQRDQRTPGGIALGFQRQVQFKPTNGADAHHGLVEPFHHNPITRPFDGVTEQVETDAGVADAGGGEGCFHADMRTGMGGLNLRSAGVDALPCCRSAGRLGYGAGAGCTARYTRAPSAVATRKRSENTPAAVTSGPAPGPCTTSALSQ